MLLLTLAPLRSDFSTVSATVQEAAVALAHAEEEQATSTERKTIYNADALHDKLEEISWVSEQPWVESQVITQVTSTEVENVDDDLARELAFYNQVQYHSRPSACKHTFCCKKH